MGISNVGSGLRSGVCTSTTRPATPYEGQVIYETDTDRVLVWNASSWVMPNTTTVNPMGIELVKVQNIGTNVGSVTVTDAFSSIYDNYLITISGGSTMSGDWGINMTLGSTNSGYYNAGFYMQYNGGTGNVNINNGSTWGALGIATTNSLYAQIFLNAPFLTKHTYFSSQYTYANIGGGHASNGGFVNNSLSYTSFTLSQSGSFNGGTIRVYGYRNSI